MRGQNFMLSILKLPLNPISTGLSYLIVTLRRGGGGGSKPPSINLIQTSYSIETWRADSLYQVLQNMLIWKRSDKNDVIMVFLGVLH